jgi:hypothetical protein
MSISRSHNDVNRFVDHTATVTEMPNQYGLFNQMGLFSEQGIRSTFVQFWKEYHTVSLLPSAPRGGRGFVKGKDKSADLFVLNTTFFKYEDRVTSEDIQNYTQVSSTDEPVEETEANIVSDKLLVGRQHFDQTIEYMKFSAATGIAVNPDGDVLANMFTEFGVTQDVVNFDLANAASEITTHVSNLKRSVAANLKMGRSLGANDLMLVVDKAFFDAYVSHPDVVDRWNQYNNSGMQRNRDNLQEFMEWGALSSFEDRGLLILEYNPIFDLADGSTTQVLGAGEGIAVVRNFTGPNSIYRGYYAPSDKKSDANKPGNQLNAWEFTDDRDTYTDIEMQSAPLFFNTRPGIAVKVTDQP